ncbi:MAG: CHAP domain-containing protein [bacterium]|nr:CHAP domain-containing protein [bacterium]
MAISGISSFINSVSSIFTGQPSSNIDASSSPSSAISTNDSSNVSAFSANVDKDASAGKSLDELRSQKTQAESELSDINNQSDEAQNKINSRKDEIIKEQQGDNPTSEAGKAYEEAKAEYEETQAYEESKAAYDKSKAEYDEASKAKATAQQNQTRINQESTANQQALNANSQQQAQVSSQLSAKQAELSSLTPPSPPSGDDPSAQSAYQAALAEYEAKKAALESEINALEAQKSQLEAQGQQLQAKQQQLAQEQQNVQMELQQQETKVQAAQTEMESAQTNMEAAQSKMEEAQQALTDESPELQQAMEEDTELQALQDEQVKVQEQQAQKEAEVAQLEEQISAAEAKNEEAQGAKADAAERDFQDAANEAGCDVAGSEAKAQNAVAQEKYGKDYAELSKDEQVTIAADVDGEVTLDVMDAARQMLKEDPSNAAARAVMEKGQEYLSAQEDLSRTCLNNSLDNLPEDMRGDVSFAMEQAREKAQANGENPETAAMEALAKYADGKAAGDSISLEDKAILKDISYNASEYLDSIQRSDKGQSMRNNLILGGAGHDNIINNNEILSGLGVDTSALDSIINSGIGLDSLSNFADSLAHEQNVTNMLAQMDGMVGLSETNAADAAQINAITQQSNIDCQTTPWCAAYAMNMMENNGVLDTSTCANVNYCPTIEKWSQDQGTWEAQGNGYTPNSGDAILFDWNGDGTAQHIGVVEKIEDGKVYTIEGNSSDAVSRRSYDLNSENIKGYINCAAQENGEMAAVGEMESAGESQSARQADKIYGGAGTDHIYNPNASQNVNSMLAEMSGMVGLSEHNAADAAQINAITGQSHIDCQTTPWCAAYAMNELNNHGILDTSSCPNVNYCPTVENWGKEQGIWEAQGNGYNPNAGDAILFDFNKEGEPHHIGIVEKIEDGKVYTIEGNASDAVSRRSYDINDDRIRGYLNCGAQGGGEMESAGEAGEAGQVGQVGQAAATNESGKASDNEIAAYIDKYLEEKGSPAAGQGTGELMVKYGKEYDVDPMLLLSIAGQETSYGKTGIGVRGMLGVGAYDSNPSNAVNNPNFSGIENQIRKGAETFAKLRAKGGASAEDDISKQTAAVNSAGWATDQNWHSNVDKIYNKIVSGASEELGSYSMPNQDISGEIMGFINAAPSADTWNATTATSMLEAATYQHNVSHMLNQMGNMVGLSENNRADAALINGITGQSNIDCQTTPWCASYAMNMLENNGVLDTSSCPNVNYCPTVKNWAEDQGIWESQGNGYNPSAGDAIMFDWDGDGNSDHMGVVEKIEDGKVYTIEGNSGDQVARKCYDLNSENVMGYINCQAQHSENDPIIGGAGNDYIYNHNASANVNSMLFEMSGMVGLSEHNAADAAQINAITGQSHIDCQTTPWCAAYAMNELNNHGILDTSSCPNVNYCPTVENWGKEQGIWEAQGNGYNPNAGDAILFDFNGEGEPHHIGIVERIEDGKVYTIEGNASDAVSRRSYDINDERIRGYLNCGAQSGKTDEIYGGSGNDYINPNASKSAGEAPAISEWAKENGLFEKGASAQSISEWAKENGMMDSEVSASLQDWAQKAGIFGNKADAQDPGLRDMKQQIADEYGIKPEDVQVISATGKDDTIKVYGNDNGEVVVNVNGTETVYTQEEAQKLIINAGKGNDIITVDANVTVGMHIMGGNGDDYIQGGGGNDVIYGGKGNDTIYGLSGNDTIYGGADNDYIDGGRGNDAIYGGKGNDNLVGGKGDDKLYGGLDDDLLIGASGSDIAAGQGGSDRVIADSDDAVTSDNDDPEVLHLETVEVPTETIKIDPNATATERERIESDLEFLASTENGQLMFEELAKTGHSITIKAGESSSCGAADLDASQQEGVGCDSTIKYNLTTTKLNGANPEATNRAPVVSLFHEMCHAYNNATGTINRNYYDQTSGDKVADYSRDYYQGSVDKYRTWGVSGAEFQAVGIDNPNIEGNPELLTENSMRDLLGYEHRTIYSTWAANEAAKNNGSN